MNWITRYYNYLKTWRKHRDIVKELNRLTNRELADIGINRGDIDRLVWLESDKKQRGKQDSK